MPAAVPSCEHQYPKRFDAMLDEAKLVCLPDLLSNFALQEIGFL